MVNAEPRSDDGEDHREGDASAAVSTTAVPLVEPANDAAAALETAEQIAADPPLRQRQKPAKLVSAMADPALENMVRVADEDRWLASRFAPKTVRQRLVTLYAFNLEATRIAERVSEPQLGEIRLQWWREAVEDIFRGGPVADHPTVRALAELVNEAGLPLEPFDAMLTARVNDLAAAPFQSWADLDAYVDATAGGLMRLATLICAPDIAFSPQRLNGLQAAGRAWGLLGLLRALPGWIERGRTFFPANLRGNLGLEGSQTRAKADEPSYAFAAHAVLDRASGAQKQIERYAQAFPKEIFPAVGYVTLTPLYLRMMVENELGRTPRQPGLFARQMKLVFAAASGKL